MLALLDVAPLAGAVAGAAAGAARGTVRGVASVHVTTRRLTHVARNALGTDRHWRAATACTSHCATPTPPSAPSPAGPPPSCWSTPTSWPRTGTRGWPGSW